MLHFPQKIDEENSNGSQASTANTITQPSQPAATTTATSSTSRLMLPSKIEMKRANPSTTSGARAQFPWSYALAKEATQEKKSSRSSSSLPSFSAKKVTPVWDKRDPVETGEWQEIQKCLEDMVSTNETANVTYHYIVRQGFGYKGGRKNFCSLVQQSLTVRLKVIEASKKKGQQNKQEANQAAADFLMAKFRLTVYRPDSDPSCTWVVC